MRFFRPDAVRISLFALFLLVAIFGSRESVAFSDGGPAPGTDLWPFWMMLLAPLALVQMALRKGGMAFDVFRAPAALFWAVQIVYFYVVACAIAALIHAAWARKKKRA